MKRKKSEMSEYHPNERNIGNTLLNMHFAIRYEKIIQEITEATGTDPIRNVSFIQLSSAPDNNRLTSVSIMLKDGIKHQGLGKLFTNSNNDDSNCLKLIADVCADAIPIELEMIDHHSGESIKGSILFNPLGSWDDLRYNISTIVNNVEIFANPECIILGLDRK